MKRAYWLLLAAVPLVLWLLSKGGAPAEPAESPAPPQPAPTPQPAPQPAAPTAEKPPVDPVPEPEASVAPTEAIAQPEPETAAPPVAQAPDQGEVVVFEPEEAPEVAAPVQTETLPVESRTQAIQLLDSRDQSYEVDLLDIDIKTARVCCVQELPANEKVRLVIPYAGQAITINAQMQDAQGKELTLKILTMKAGQKKRFDEYLAQR